MDIENFFKITPHQFKTPVITIGMFDGVHRGHQNLISKVKSYAAKLGGKSIVVTFKDHPKEFLTGKGPLLIMPFYKRLEFFKNLGVDICLVISLTTPSLNISSDIFIKDHLIKQIGIKGIVVGEDFRFGHKGAGNRSLLEKYSQDYNYKVIVSETLQKDQQKISSTNIRNAVLSNNFEQVQMMLGRPFTLVGRVGKGRQIGRTLGFPTANIELFHDLKPHEGVYYGNSIVDGIVYPALISIGVCATFNKRENVKIEIYLVNFDGDLYGKILEVSVLRKIREQKKFANADELVRQITDDKNYVLKECQSP